MRVGVAWRGLAFQLIALTILPLTALLVAIALGSITIHQREMRSLVARQDERAVRAAAAALAERLGHRADSLRALADRAASAEVGSRRPLQDILTESSYLIADFDGGVALLSAQAEWLAASTPESDWAMRPIAALISPGPTQGSAPRFSTPFDDGALGLGAVAMAAASTDGAVIAVGVFSPAALGLPELASGLGSGPRVHVLLDSRQGGPLFEFERGSAAEEHAVRSGVDAALRGESGAIYGTAETAGEEFVIAYSPVAPPGWALVVEEPWADVVSPLLQTSQLGPLVLAPALLLAGLGLGLAVRRVIRPLQQLERQSARLASGDFAAIEKPVNGIGEVESLQKTLVHMARQVRAYQEAIRRYLGALTRGQEDERRRLARELHDDTVQSLIALDQRAQLAQMAVRHGSSQAAERLAEVRQMAAALIEEVRRVIRALRPIYLEDLGLLPAIEMLARDLETTTGLRVSFLTTGEARRLAPEHEIALFRIVQEALNNIARHAGARAVDVSAVFEADALIVRVKDDGRGFAAPERVSDLAAAGHYGLMGMQERADLIGARLSIQSTPGAGTTIELRLPLA